MYSIPKTGKIKLGIIALLMSIVSVAHAQIGSVKGTVKTSDGKPAEFVVVGIKGGKSAVVNNKGEYTLSNLREGEYTISASYIGLESQSKIALVVAGTTTTINFVLKESGQQLEEVIVSETKTNPYYTKRSESVARLPLENLENPQVYTTISQDLMKVQVITNFSDALKNATGLDKLWSSTGRGGDGAAYYNLRGFTTQATLINGLAGLTNGDVDPSNVDKIEVIKGPSGTLFGGALTNFGGLININTKKPLETSFGEINYTLGSYNLSRLTADINGKVSKNKDIFARINGAYHYQTSFQDAGFRKSFFIAPSVEYRVNEKLTLNVNAEFLNYEGTNPTMVFLNRSRKLIATTPDELEFDFRRSYTSNDIIIKTPVANINGQVKYKISDNWTSQTSFSRGSRKSEGIYHYVMYLGASDTLLSRNASLQNSVSTATNIQQNFTGDFKIAGLRNRLVVGMDYLNQQNINANSAYIKTGEINSSVFADSRYFINYAHFMSMLGAANPAPVKTHTNNNVYSAYASNVINFTDKFLAMLSLRVDRFENKGSYNQATNITSGDYKQTAFSPKFGLVYQVVKDQVSLFANYLNGFKNIQPATQPLADISGTMKPQHGNQLEGGIKLDILRNKLSATVSYYDISVNNIVREVGIIRDGTSYNIKIQDGTQESKGFELDLIANPITDLNIIFGYSHNDSKMTKSAPEVEGRRPVDAGPEDQINFWASYKFSKNTLKGFGLGFGGNYASENKITNGNTTGVFTLPAYTVFNATAFYDIKALRFGIKLDNLTDKTYYKGWTTVEMQTPRTVSANISYRF